MAPPHATPAPAALLAGTEGQRERFSAVYSLVEEGIATRAFPGCAFGILYEGAVVALEGLGRFTYADDAPAVTPGTVYDLASLTKVLATTAAAMLLFDRGLLHLDEPVAEILPGFAAGEGAGSTRSRVTVGMLLDHSSGLPGYAPLFQTARDASALFQAALEVPLQSEPGARAEYSDIGFILLGRLLELRAGEALDIFCQREIFTPLGMTGSCYRPPPAWRSSISPAEDDRTFRHRVIQGEVHDENASVLGGVSGHAGLFSNAIDPLRLAACLLSGGQARDGRQLFAGATVDLFTRRTGRPAESSRALGWDTPSAPSSSGSYYSPHSAGHLGFTGTSLWIDFEQQLAVVLLTNRTWPTRENQAIRQFRPRFHDAILRTLLPARKLHASLSGK